MDNIDNMNMKPCPFCGSRKFNWRVERPYSQMDTLPGEMHFIECGYCNARGPMVLRVRHHAEAVWNHRVTPPPFIAEDATDEH